jgi:hypothetical protein
MTPQAPLDKDEKWVVDYSVLFKWTGKTFDQKLSGRK